MADNLFEDAFSLELRWLQNSPLRIFHKTMGDVGTPVGVIPTYPLGSHLHAEMALLVEGRAAMFVEGRRYEMQVGEPILLLPYTMHAECFSSKNRPYKIMWCGFAGLNTSFSISVYDPGKDRYSPEGKLLLATDSVLKLFSLCAKIESEGGLSELVVARLHAMTMLLACDALEVLARTGVSYGQALAEHSVRQTLSFIQENYSRQISVKDIAHLLRLSPNHLNALFKRATGKPILRHIIDTRIEAAKKLLCGENASIKNVAKEVGIDDPLYFCRLFRARTGLSPSEFIESQPSVRRQ